MKNIHLISIFAICLASCTTNEPAPYGVIPTEAQVEWQKLEYNMFVHFGPNTFTGHPYGRK